MPVTIVQPYSRLLNIGFVLLISSFVISNYATSPVVAQTSEPTSPSTTVPGLPTIQITSPQDGQQVPPGELTIQGISSDDEQTDCQVYADVNDVTPMRNVTARWSRWRRWRRKRLFKMDFYIYPRLSINQAGSK